MIRRVLAVGLMVLAAFVATAPAAQAQYAPGQPGFILVPSTTPPNGTVSAVGFGCPPRSRVDVFLEDTLVVQTVALDDGQGSFEASFTAPPTAGQYVVTVKCGDIVMTQILTVLLEPSLVINPEVTCNTQVELTATGYKPGTIVEFSYNPTLGTAQADANGVARVVVSPPPEGSYTIKSSGESQVGGVLELFGVLQVSCGTLPPTGSDSDTLVIGGVSLIVIGGLLVLAARRRHTYA